MTCIANSLYDVRVVISGGTAVGLCKTLLQRQSSAHLHTKLHAQRSRKPERFSRPFCSRIKATMSEGRLMTALRAMLSETGVALLSQLESLSSELLADHTRRVRCFFALNGSNCMEWEV